MYEAEINMVLHANGGSIDVDITPEKIYILFQDEGPELKILNWQCKKAILRHLMR